MASAGVGSMADAPQATDAALLGDLPERARSGAGDKAALDREAETAGCGGGGGAAAGMTPASV